MTTTTTTTATTRKGTSRSHANVNPWAVAGGAASPRIELVADRLLSRYEWDLRPGW
jgi:hypothetical protein